MIDTAELSSQVDSGPCIKDDTYRPSAKPVWTIRPLQLSDLVTHAWRHRYYEEGSTELDVTIFVEWARNSLIRGNYLGLVAVVDGEIVGGAAAALLDYGPTLGHSVTLFARLMNVYVDESYRGKGMARELCTALLESLKARGVRRFRLMSTPQGAPLYHELGFTPATGELMLDLPGTR